MRARAIAAGFAMLAALYSGLVAADSAPAQGVKDPPNALQGFSFNRDLPVTIKSGAMEVRDKAKVATFLGNVVLTQGDTTLRCKTLVVHYDGTPGKPGKSMTAATPGPGGSQQISRVEATGDVVVCQREQTASGDRGIFDVRANKVSLTGNVVLTQGQNVVRGDTLEVDLTTGRSRVLCDRKECQVEALYLPNSPKDQRQSVRCNEVPAAMPTGPRRFN